MSQVSDQLQRFHDGQLTFDQLVDWAKGFRFAPIERLNGPFDWEGMTLKPPPDSWTEIYQAYMQGILTGEQLQQISGAVRDAKMAAAEGQRGVTDSRFVWQPGDIEIVKPGTTPPKIGDVDPADYGPPDYESTQAKTAGKKNAITTFAEEQLIREALSGVDPTNREEEVADGSSARNAGPQADGDREDMGYAN